MRHQDKTITMEFSPIVPLMSKGVIIPTNRKGFIPPENSSRLGETESSVEVVEQSLHTKPKTKIKIEMLKTIKEHRISPFIFINIHNQNHIVKIYGISATFLLHKKLLCCCPAAALLLFSALLLSAAVPYFYINYNHISTLSFPIIKNIYIASCSAALCCCS